MVLEKSSWLGVVMEEYKTVRQEGLNAVQHQHNVLQFGSVALAAEFGVGFTMWDKDILPEIIFLLFVPCLAYLLLFIWNGETGRMVRAGKFILELESKVNKEFPGFPEALTWETWLRNNPKNQYKLSHLLSKYISTIMIFFGIALGSVIIGAYKMVSKDYSFTSVGLILFSEIIVLLIIIVIVANICKNFD